MSMVMDPLMDRMCSASFLSMKRSITISTMLNFDSDRHGNGHRDGTCKQTFKFSWYILTDRRHLSLNFPNYSIAVIVWCVCVTK